MNAVKTIELYRHKERHAHLSELNAIFIPFSFALIKLIFLISLSSFDWHISDFAVRVRKQSQKIKLFSPQILLNPKPY